MDSRTDQSGCGSSARANRSPDVWRTARAGGGNPGTWVGPRIPNQPSPDTWRSDAELGAAYPYLPGQVLRRRQDAEVQDQAMNSGRISEEPLRSLISAWWGVDCLRNSFTWFQRASLFQLKVHQRCHILCNHIYINIYIIIYKYYIYICIILLYIYILLYSCFSAQILFHWATSEARAQITMIWFASHALYANLTEIHGVNNMYISIYLDNRLVQNYRTKSETRQ
jgi:hypothetical protein